MNVALDTNILVYAEGVDGEAKRAPVEAILRTLPAANTIMPVQVLGELFNVLIRKSEVAAAERAQICP